jgi:hypothetical protein
MGIEEGTGGRERERDENELVRNFSDLPVASVGESVRARERERASGKNM